MLDWRHDHPGGDRQVAYLGEIQVGAIFPAGERSRARWIFWLGGPTQSFWHDVKKGGGEAEAKAAVLERTTDWLRRAGLTVVAAQ